MTVLKSLSQSIRLLYLKGHEGFRFWLELQQAWLEEGRLGFARDFLKLQVRHWIVGQAPNQIDRENALLFYEHPPALLTRTYCDFSAAFFEWQGEPVLKQAQLLEFQKVSAHVYVDQLVAAFLAQKYVAGELKDSYLKTVAQLQRFPKVKSPLLDDIFNRGLVDLHQHYNASQLTTSIWVKALEKPRAMLNELRGDGNATLLPPVWHDKDLYYHLCNAKSWRAFLQMCLFIEQERLELEPDHLASILDKIKLLLAGTHNHYRKRTFHHHEFVLPTWVEPDFLVNECDFLTQCFIACYRIGETHPRLVCEQQQLFYLGFHYYLIMQNVFLKSFVQQEEHFGFESFARFERAPVHLAYRRKDFQHALHEYRETHHLKAIELRLVPEKQVFKQVRKLKPFLDTLDRQQQNPERSPELHDSWTKCLETVQAQQDQWVKCGFNFHVIKARDPQFKREAFLLGADRDRGVFSDQQSLHHVARHHQLRIRVFLQMRALVIAKHYDRRYPAHVLGIDAANDEAFARPEVFAPAFCYARDAFPQEQVNHHKGKPPTKEMVRPLRITFHAGESFDHLLNGIRHVDEALTFLDMRRGDRIGHGLALGIDPKNWVERFGDCRVFKGEWLDSLVWMHETLRLGNLDFPVSMLHQLSTEIDQLKHEVYGESFRGYRLNLETAILHRAWQFRAQEASSSVKDHCPEIEAAYRAAKKALPEDAFRLWLAYHFSTKVRQAYYKPNSQAKVFANEKIWVDSLRLCQQLVMQKLMDREIAIEVNPTSNLRIGPFDDMKDHPIFRWFPVRPEDREQEPGPICTINGDNYAVFQTTLPLEYAYLAAAAKERGDYSPTQIASWLNQLRVNGFKHSFLDLGSTQYVGY
jgi:adenosine deaminase